MIKIFFKLFRRLGCWYHKKRTRVFLRSDDVVVFGAQDILFEDRITIGSGCSLNHGVYINGMGGVVMGDRVTISAGAAIVTAGLDLDSKNKAHLRSEINIKSGAWIGAGAIILPGVTVGENSVVAAGSIVTKDIPSNEIWAGIPASRLKERKS